MAGANTTVNRVTMVLLWMTVAWCFGWTMVGAWHCFPNAEDLALSALVQERGVVGSVVKLLRSYDGRYFTNFLHTLNPLVWGWFKGYQLMPLIGIMAVSCSLWFLLRSFGGSRSWRISPMLLAVLYMAVHIAHTPSLPHDVFWMISSFVYMWPWALLFLFLGSLVNYHKAENGAWKNFWFVASALWLICGIGMNAMFLVIYTVLFVGLSYLGLKRSGQATQMLPLVIIGTSSIAFFLNCPGIDSRMADQAVVRDAVHAWRTIVVSAVHLSSLFQKLFFENLTLVSWATVAAIALPSAVHVRLSHLSSTSAFLVSVAFLACIWVMSWPFYWAMGAADSPPVRIQTTLFYGIQLWAWCIVAWCVSKLMPVETPEYERPPVVSGLLLVVVVMLLTDVVLSQNNTSSLRAEYTNGKMESYKRQMLDRHQKLTKGLNSPVWAVVTLEPLYALPSTVSYPPFLYPNRTPPYWNAAYERYYGLHEVRMAGDTVSKLNLIFISEHE